MNELHNIEPLLQKFRSGTTSANEEHSLLESMRQNEHLLPPDWKADMMLLERLEVLSLHVSDSEQQAALCDKIDQLAAAENNFATPSKKRQRLHWAAIAVAACAAVVLLLALPKNSPLSTSNDTKLASLTPETAHSSSTTASPSATTAATSPQIPATSQTPTAVSARTQASIATTRSHSATTPLVAATLAEKTPILAAVDTLSQTQNHNNNANNLATVISPIVPELVPTDSLPLHPAPIPIFTPIPTPNPAHNPAPTPNLALQVAPETSPSESHSSIELQGGIGILAAMSPADGSGAKAGVSGNMGVNWDLAVNDNCNLGVGVNVCGYASQESFTHTVTTIHYDPGQNGQNGQNGNEIIVIDTFSNTYTTPSLYIGMPFSVKLHAAKQFRSVSSLILSFTPSILAWEFLPTTANGNKPGALYNPLKLTLGVGIDTKRLGVIRRLGLNANLLPTYNSKQSTLPSYHEFGIEIGF